MTDGVQTQSVSPVPREEERFPPLDSAKIAAMFHPGAKAAPVPKDRAHFEVLDAFRGVAALCVMLHHFGNTAHVRLGQTGFIAVDFFFVLSGFVIAFAYDKRLAQGFRFRDYLRTRMIRLYPMVIFSAATALALYLCAGREIGQAPWPTAIVMTICGILLVPYLGVIGPSFAEVDSFPLNNPSWSLSEELVVNAAYGLVGPRLGVKITAALTVLFGIGVALIGIKLHSMSFGWHQGSWLMGLVRCSYSFLYGALIAKVLSTRKIKQKMSNLRVLAIGGVLFFVLCMPYLHIISGVVVAFMLIAGFPLIVILGIGVRCEGKAAKLASLAGRLSYPMYLLHYPIMSTAGALVYANGLSGRTAALIGLFCAADVIVLSWLALKLDEPLRKFLSSKWRSVPVPAASAP